MEHMQDLASQNPDKQKEMAKKLEEGKLSIRDWREQISNVMNMCDRYAPIASEVNVLTDIQGTAKQNCVHDTRSPARPAARFG